MTFDALRPTKAGRFSLSAKTSVMDRDDVSRAIRRITHEVIEKNRGVGGLIVVGVESGGIWLAEEIARNLGEIGSTSVPFFPLDVSKHRDDRVVPGAFASQVGGGSVSDKVILLVDDVLFTGRTVRAALDAIIDYGRPKTVQLAVLVDRGHRELPIRADFVGKNLPTSRQEIVIASVDGVEIGVLSE